MSLSHTLTKMRYRIASSTFSIYRHAENVGTVWKGIQLALQTFNLLVNEKVFVKRFVCIS